MSIKNRFKYSMVIVPFILSGCSKGVPTIYHTQQEWKDRFKVSEYQENKVITGEYDARLAATCHNGTFVGKLDDETKVKMWKGIPFGKINKRFERSIMPDDSNQVYEAYYFGKSCLQPALSGELASEYEQGDNDCLTLAIYTKDNDIKNKPVIVYIHGGGWLNGGTCDPLYDGRNFAYYNPEIIIVDITYRVGLLGQINLSMFSDYSANVDTYKTSTSNGILDQIQALRYIKKNIEAFGGDKNNITICGESAGGGSVSTLTMLQSSDSKYLPKNENLFQKAISMSGGINQYVTLDSSKRLGNELMKTLGVNTIADLQNIPLSELQEWWTVESHHTDLVNFCTLDGEVIPTDPYRCYNTYVKNDIKVMQGATTNEFAYYKTILPFDRLGCNFEDVCQAIMDYATGDYDPTVTGIAAFTPSNAFMYAYQGYMDALKETCPNPMESLRQFANDVTLQGINYYLASKQSQNGGDTYVYAFDQSFDGSLSYLKAAHAIDCFYLFGNFDGDHSSGNNEEVNLSIKFQSSIASFLKNGSPNDWPAYNTIERKCMQISTNEYKIIDKFKSSRHYYLEMMIDNNVHLKYFPAWSDLFEIIDANKSK